MAARCWNCCLRTVFSSSERRRSSCSCRISSWNWLVSSCCWILASKKFLAPPTPTSSTLISVKRANAPRPDSRSRSPAFAFLLVSSLCSRPIFWLVVRWIERAEHEHQARKRQKVKKKKQTKNKNGMKLESDCWFNDLLLHTTAAHYTQIAT